MYGPYGWGPPQQPSYVPVPQGTDIERVLRIVERLQKKETRKSLKAKLEEEEKKKKDKPKPPEAPKINILTAFLLMTTFGLPVGYLNLVVMTSVAEAIKTLLK